MKWIDAEQKVTVTIYDEEHEEHHDKIMTVEEMLDTYTNEGCPTMYSNPERKTGKWHILDECANEGVYCSECIKKVFKIDFSNTMKWKNFRYCPNCGSYMGGIEIEDE
jgi:ribosomal protein L34E